MRLNRRSDHASLSWAQHQKHADINHLKGLDWSDSLDLVRKRFEKIPLKFRDPRVESALQEIEAQAASKKHLVEFLLTLYRAGFSGVEASQELICEAIARAAHAHMFGVRTFQNAVKWAIAAGLITQAWTPIGRRGRAADGSHVTLRIRRYTLTYKIRLLVSVLRADPEKYRVQLVSMPQKPTYEKNSPNPNGEQPGRAPKSPSGMLLIHDVVKDDLEQARNTALAGNEEPANAGTSTCPPRSAPSATCEHQASKKDRLKNEPRRSQDYRRARNPKTYATARKAFLHELFLCLKPGSFCSLPNANTLYQVAELQTDPYYPKFLPAACDWYEAIQDHWFLSWHNRRKNIAHRILPELREYCEAWTPPELDFERQKNAHTLFSDWERSLCPEPGISIRPESIAEYFRLWPFVRAVISGAQSGALDRRELFKTESIVRRFCDFFYLSE